VGNGDLLVVVGDVEGVFAGGEARAGDGGKWGVGLDVAEGLRVVGGTLLPVEAAGLHVESHGAHVLNHVVVDDGDEEDETGAVADAGAREEEAEHVGRAVGEGIAEDGETGVDVVPGRVAEDRGIAVALLPDIKLEAPAPLVEAGLRGELGGAALEQTRER
jgi:hypothetical protein